MTIEQTLKTARVTLKDAFKSAHDLAAALTLVRRDLAAALSKRDVPLPEMPAAINSLLALQTRADEAVAAIPAEEETLRGLERELVVSNNDAAFAERDAKLRELAMNRARIAILREEGEARVTALRKAIVDEEDRQFARASLAEYEPLMAKIGRIEALEKELVEILEAAKTASAIRDWMWRRHKKNPDVEELDIPCSPEIDRPGDMLTRLAKKYTELRDAPARPRVYVPGVGVV